mmetsp:Transcript_40530/g.71268  ORF Transcript_40530/g.71268 Transcript_40530/m.71268 type:complete len:533 (-) Transcript_40530:110-1708(-)
MPLPAQPDCSRLCAPLRSCGRRACGQRFATTERSTSRHCPSGSCGRAVLEACHGDLSDDPAACRHDSCASDDYAVIRANADLRHQRCPHLQQNTDRACGSSSRPACPTAPRVQQFARRCLVIVASVFLTPAGALHMHVDANALPWFWTPLLPKVGLDANATIYINLKTSQPAPNAFVLFFSEKQFIAAAHVFPPHRRHSSSYLPCNWRSSLAEPVQAWHRVQAPGPGRYWLGIIQTVPGAVQGLSGEVSFVNPGGEELYVQQHAVPTVILVVAWLFFMSATALFALTALRRRGRSRLHVLMLFTLLAKCFVLLLVRQDFKQVSKTGVQSVPREVVWQLLRQVQSIMEVVVFYVIGLGWKVTRPQLRASEWAFAATISILSFFLGSFEVACSTFAACAGTNYVLTQFTLHSLCYLVVIVATNFNIFTLQRQISEALATPVTGTLYTKYRAYCWFRGFFLFFVVIPSVTNFLALHVLSWHEFWVVVLVREASLWLVHTSVLVLFRPGKQQFKVFELAVVESSDSESTDMDEMRE